MSELLKFFLPLYFLIFIAAAFGYRIYITRKRFGVNPYFLGKLDSVHGLMARIVILGVLGSLAVSFIYTFWPDLYSALSPIPALERPALTWLGVALLLISLVWIIVAQVQMGASWRMGVDESQKTQLVTTGVFLYSRNPIYLGMAVILLGLFLVLPNSLSLALIIGGIALMHLQILLEEQYLRGKHGSAYEEYRRRVRRWL